MPYILHPKHIYPAGTLVEVVNTSHWPVMIVSKDGDLFSCPVDWLGEEPPVIEVPVVERPIDLFNQPL